MRILFDLQSAQSGSKTRGIGRYAINLASSLATIATDHEVWLLLSGGGDPEGITGVRAMFRDLIPAEQIRVFETPGPVGPHNPANVWAIRAAECIREYAVAQLCPDVVVVGSLFEGGLLEEGLVTSVGEFTSGERTAVVLYDLIPFQEPHTYLHNREARVHYARKLDSLLNAELLLAISDYSRQEAIDLLGVDAHRIVAIGSAAGESFIPAERSEQTLDRLGIDRDFVLCCPSGYEPRKNLERLIAAFGSLPSEVRDRFQLVLASKITKPDLIRVGKVVTQSGLRPSDVVFTDHVEDSELVALYSSAHLCVVPSLREGFGLPAIEAMKCGTPVIGSNTTSLPEAIGRDDALFDPRSVESIRDLIERALLDEGFRRSLIDHAHVHAQKFSWEVTARKALTALEARFDTPRSSERLRIAEAFAPDGGILATLSGDHDIEVYAAGLPEHLPADYDHLLYHVTAQTSPASISSNLERNHGVVVVHEPLRDTALPAASAWLNAAIGVVTTDEHAFHQLTAWFGQQSPRLLRHVAADQGATEILDFLLRTADAADTDVARLAESIGSLPELSAHRDRMPRIAAAIAQSTVPAFRRRRLLVDISILVDHDARTGIQRVVRSQLDAFLHLDGQMVAVEPVYFKGVNDRPYLHHARQFTARFRSSPGSSPVDDVVDDVVDVHAGDIYYGLDLNHGGVIAADESGLFAHWRARGVRVAFLAFDLLPVLRPEFFELVPHLTEQHRAWLQAVADNADLVVCISESVSDQLRAWMRETRHPRAESLTLAYAHLGHDLEASKPSTGIPEDGADLLAQLSSRPSILMVGTVEPRKGYRQALAGIDVLWGEGLDANLVIVGGPGWDPAESEAIRTHSELGKRLFWLSDISDEFLTRVYAACTGLLMASEGEGFGLPLVEAARHGLPILVRDLPVCREVAGDGATYFSGLKAADLANAIRAWLSDVNSGNAPSSTRIRRRTWAEHADEVVNWLLAGGVRHE